MLNSLYSSEVNQVFAKAEQLSGLPGGPFASPVDWRDHLIYFIMVDRFNNSLKEPNHLPYDDPIFYGYQGGSFTGIQKQLPYIKQLGAGAIWLSPVLKNLGWDGGSYHGYGIHDFIRAEPKFANVPANADDELRGLVDAAHAIGLYVIFDIVLNHTGDIFAYQQGSQAPYSPTPLPIYWRNGQGQAVQDWQDISTIQNPPEDGLVWPIELQNNGMFRRQGNAVAGGDDTIGDFASLKQILTDNENSQKALIRAYQYIIARYDVDGFRIDTLRYLKGNLAQTFGNAMREYGLILGKKNFFTFGEVLGGGTDEEAVIANFIGRNTRYGDDMNSLVGVDAALDYPLFFVIVSVLKGSAPPSSVVAVYNDRKTTEQYILSSHGDSSRYFVTFLDNHDMHYRFRWIEPGDEHKYDDQVTMAFACLYCLPGIPAVYYGTEQGLHGYSNTGQDAAVREALWGLFPNFSNATSFYIQLKAAAAVRKAEAALRYGRFYFRPISGDSIHFGISTDQGGVIAWSRILNDEEVIIVANTNTTNPIGIDVILELTLSSIGQKMNLLYSNKANPGAPGDVRQLSGVSVQEIDGSTGHGPLNTTRVTLQPMEVQILRGAY